MALAADGGGAAAAYSSSLVCALALTPGVPCSKTRVRAAASVGRKAHWVGLMCFLDGGHQHGAGCQVWRVSSETPALFASVQPGCVHHLRNPYSS